MRNGNFTFSAVECLWAIVTPVSSVAVKFNLFIVLLTSTIARRVQTHSFVRCC